MKKTFAIMTALALLALALPARNLSLALSVSYLGAADSGFKEVYGSGGVMPGLRLEAALLKGLSLYASYGYFAKKGETPVLKEEARATHHYLTLGAAWRKGLSDKLGLGIYGGLLYAKYKEEALGATISDSAVGFEIGGDLRYWVSGKLFVSPFVSYMLASDTVEDVKIKLGGFRAGLGLGLGF